MTLKVLRGSRKVWRAAMRSRARRVSRDGQAFQALPFREP
jgi:hypothetical protein